MKKRILAVLLALCMIAINTVAAVAVPASNQEKSDIRIVGWNLLNTPGTSQNGFWSYYTINQRAERTVNILQKYDADSIGFQEGNINWKSLLNANLTNYRIVESSQETSNLIYYRSDRMEVVESGVFWLSETPEQPSKAPSSEGERSCAWAILKNKTTGVMYAHFNTHLDLNDQARLFGMQVICQKISELRSKSGYQQIGILLTGDFNCNVMSDPYRMIVQTKGAAAMGDTLCCVPQDTTHIVNEGLTWFADLEMPTQEEMDSGLAIDHIFVSYDTLNAQYYQVMRDTDADGKRPSDHFGIYAEYQVGEGCVKRDVSHYWKQTSIDTCNVAYATPALDGEMENIWAATPENEFLYRNNTASDLSARYRLLHDDNYLYLFVNVDDQSIADGDYVQFYFDMINTDYLSGTNDAIYQGNYTWDYLREDPNNCVTNHSAGSIRFRPFTADASKRIDPTDGGTGLGDKIQFETKETAKGYTVEARIPMSDQLKEKLNADGTANLSYALFVTDFVQGNDNRVNYLFSSERVIDTWAKPYLMHNAHLEPSLSAATAITRGTPVVDGKKDSLYQFTQNIYVNRNYKDNSSEGPVVDADHATAIANFSYDSDYMYGFVEVTDPTLNADDIRPAKENYDVDGVQIYLDLDTADGQKKCGYILMDPTATDDQKADGSKIQRTFNDFASYAGNKELFDYQTTKGTGKYTVEFRIALPDSAKQALAAGQDTAIRYGVVLSDDTDNNGTRNQWTTNMGTCFVGWADVKYLSTGTLVQQYPITVTFSADKAIATAPATAKAGTVIPLSVVAKDGYAVNPNSITVNGDSISNGYFIMPDKAVEIDADVQDIRDVKYQVIVPELTGITITPDKATAKAGERVTLNIQLEDGYDFRQYDGGFDYSGAFVSSLWGEVMMGRALCVNGQSIPYSGNSFIMPASDAVITVELKERPVYNAVKSQITLDGEKDAAYEGSKVIEVSRSASSNKQNTPSSRAIGYLQTAYDNNYLYCYTKVLDATPSTNAAVAAEANLNKSLLSFDNVIFFFDFLNTDTANTAANRYSFAEGESGWVIIDALDLQKAADGTIYDKLAGGFASYNGNHQKADYIVRKMTDGYVIELKIALSDSLKAKLKSADSSVRPEIGIGAVVTDDKNNNGAFDYEATDVQAFSNHLLANNFMKLAFERTNSNHLQMTCGGSPVWLGRMVLDDGAEIPSSDTSSQTMESTDSGSSFDVVSDQSSENSSEDSSAVSNPTDSAPSTPNTGSSSFLVVCEIALLIAAGFVSVLSVRKNQHTDN